MPDLNSEALSLFLQYTHHHRQPDLSTLSFKCLTQLAEAVEKYDVYSATEICKMHMRYVFFRSTPLQSPKVRVASPHVENHCVEIFQYASKHGYRKLMDDAALIAVQKKIFNNQISNVCNRPDLQSAWVRVYPLHCESTTNFLFVDAESVQRILAWSIYWLLWWASTCPAPWWNPILLQVAEILECCYLPSEAWDHNILKVLRNCSGCEASPHGLPSLWHTCGQVEGKSAAEHLYYEKDDTVYLFFDLGLEPLLYLTLEITSSILFLFFIQSWNSKVTYMITPGYITKDNI